MSKYLCGECIHNSDKGGGCLIPKNLGYVDNCNRYLPKDRPIVQTNEEYLKSCNTEQLADFLAQWITFPCELCNIWHNPCKGYNNKNCSVGEDIEAWEKWLKEVHTNE